MNAAVLTTLTPDSRIRTSSSAFADVDSDLVCRPGVAADQLQVWSCVDRANGSLTDVSGRPLNQSYGHRLLPRPSAPVDVAGVDRNDGARDVPSLVGHQPSDGVGYVDRIHRLDRHGIEQRPRELRNVLDDFGDVAVP